mgnify:CR=1 FL=1
MFTISLRNRSGSSGVRSGACDHESLIGAALGVDDRIGEQRLLVMTSLLIADELGNAQEQLANQTPQQPQPVGLSDAQSDELAENIETMADRVEAIADKLAQS